MSKRRALIAAASLILAPTGFVLLWELRNADESLRAGLSIPQVSPVERELLHRIRTPLAGDTVTLEIVHYDRVALADSSVGQSDYADLVALHHVLEVSGLEANAEVTREENAALFFVAAGTRCTVVDPGVLLYEVRVRQGEHAGRRAFVDRQRVVKLSTSPK